MSKKTVYGTCSCGGYGQLFDPETAKDLDTCHLTVPEQRAAEMCEANGPDLCNICVREFVLGQRKAA